MDNHAEFYTMFFDKFIVVIDIDNGKKSVTNDIEWILKKISPTEGIRLFYRDSMKTYTEIIHDGNQFINFKHTEFVDLFDLYFNLAKEKRQHYLILPSRINVYQS